MALSGGQKQPEQFKEPKDYLETPEVANDNEKPKLKLAVDNTAKFEEAERKLRTNKLEKLPANIKMLRSFAVDYQRELKDLGESPRICVLHSKKHVEASLVETGIFKDADILYLEDTKGKAGMMGRLGVDAEKRNPEKQLLDEPVDIMIAFYDEDAEASAKFTKNIKRGGWLLCRGDMAAELLQNGSEFKYQGKLQDDPLNRSEKSTRELNWEEAVGNDSEFQSSSEEVKDGSRLATYDKAVAALRAAGRPTGEQSGNVLGNYKQFIEDLLKDKNAKVDYERGIITYTTESGEKIEVEIELPMSDANRDKIVVLQRRRAGEARGA